MAVELVRGYRDTFNAVSTNQKRDIQSLVQIVGLFKTPFYQKLFFSDRQQQVVVSPTGKFEWYVKQFSPHNVTTLQTVTGGPGVTSYSLEAADIGATYLPTFKAGDLLLAEGSWGVAQELIVTSVSDTAIVVKPVAETGDITTMPSGTIIKKIGSSYAETAASVDSISRKEEQNENYLTIMKESFSHTGREAAGEKYTSGLSAAEQFRLFLEEFKLMVERNFLLATSSGRLSGTKRTYGKGVNGMITTNVGTYATEITKATLDTFLDGLADNGTFQCTIYCGGTAYADFQDIVYTKWNGNMGANNDPTKIDTFGIRAMRYLHPRVEVEIVYDFVMDGKYTYWVFAINEDALLKGRFMAPEPEKGQRKLRISDATPVGADTTVKLLLADIGVQLGAEMLCGKLYRTS